MLRTLPGLIAAAAAVAAVGVPAVASARPGPGPGNYGSSPRPGIPDEPPDSLTLSYQADAGYADAVKLTCRPVGGGHPAAKAACATLDRIGADPDQIKPATSACFLIYAPITAQITGVWRGAQVEWKHRYGNKCEMVRATGVLFSF